MLCKIFTYSICCSKINQSRVVLQFIPRNMFDASKNLNSRKRCRKNDDLNITKD